MYLREKQVGFCKGCLACLKLGHCVIQDDAVEIAAKMHDANVLVFATPVYYYCAQRSAQDYAGSCQPIVRYGTTPLRKPTCLQRRQRTHLKPLRVQRKPVQGWVDCFPHCALAGTVFAGGVNGVGRNRRSCCTGASLSDGQGGVSHGI